jgi:hypothetical protein
MLPTDFPQSNFKFNKPSEMTDEQCMGGIPVWKGLVPYDEEGNCFPTIISCWRFNKEDLEEIQRTGVIWVAVTGETLPPFSLYTETPFEETNKENETGTLI